MAAMAFCLPFVRGSQLLGHGRVHRHRESIPAQVVGEQEHDVGAIIRKPIGRPTTAHHTKTDQPPHFQDTGTYGLGIELDEVKKIHKTGRNLRMCDIDPEPRNGRRRFPSERLETGVCNAIAKWKPVTRTQPVTGGCRSVLRSKPDYTKLTV